MADEQAKRKLTEPTTADQKPASSSSSEAKTPDEESISIAKPEEGGLEKFRSKRPPNIAGVETLLTALPHHKIGEAGDFVRLHPDEGAYWSPEGQVTTAIAAGRSVAHGDDTAAAETTLRSARLGGPDAVNFLRHVVCAERFATVPQRARAACAVLEVGGFLKSTGAFRESEGTDSVPEREGT